MTRNETGTRSTPPTGGHTATDPHTASPKSKVTAASPRGRVLQAIGFVTVGSAGLQISAALSAGLFSSLGNATVSSLRFLLAAPLMVLIFRPNLRGITRTEWLNAAVLGGAMALMNLALFAAIDRLPLGVAISLDFLGPCAVALLAAKRVRDGLCALGALGGVVLIAGPGGHFDAAGFGFGLLAALGFAGYTLFSERVGKSNGGVATLALSVTVAALLTLPWGIGAIPTVTGREWLVLLISAVLGVVLTFSVDTIAAGRTSARVVGTLFSIDPVLGALFGLVLLDQQIGLITWCGILLVAASGALLVWFTSGTTKREAWSVKREVVCLPFFGQWFMSVFMPIMRADIHRSGHHQGSDD